MSKVSRGAVLTVLAKHYTDVRITIIDNLSDLEALVERRPNLVFLGMKFIPVDHDLGLQDPNKIWIAKYLDARGIAYTGSDQMAHELERNKPLAKQRVLEAGLITSRFYVARQNQAQHEGSMSLTFPLFIKPTSRGGGQGIDSDSVVNNFDQLHSKVNSIAADLKSDSLVEEYLPGREFSVAILKDEHSSQFSLMPIELIAPLDKHGLRILSSQVKSADTESFAEVTDKNIEARVTALAIDVFHALGARDYGRIDIRLDKAGVPHFLEANLIPSLINGYGNFPKACLLNMNLGFESMILSIVKLGLARSTNMTDEEFEQNRLIVPSLEPAFVATA
ncbi:MAG: D-alanine--D-alanine ligase [bacterium]|nr:D-alanine--D-alanine ligase [bacterium]